MLFTFANDAKTKFDEYDKACREALSLIDEKMTDLEKALVLHDHVLAVCKYAYQSDGVSPDKNYSTSYDCLVKHKAVCQGYTMGYNSLLRRAGIGVGTTQSIEIDHVWSLVKLDDNWYSVDVTWKDEDIAFFGN